jgi:hypothetical protein
MPNKMPLVQGDWKDRAVDVITQLRTAVLGESPGSHVVVPITHAQLIELVAYGRTASAGDSYLIVVVGDSPPQVTPPQQKRKYTKRSDVWKKTKNVRKSSSSGRKTSKSRKAISTS